MTANVTMKPPGADMAAELSEAPAIVQAQARELAAPLAALIARLVARPPNVVVTCARGSSAHAAAFAKHLIERNLGHSGRSGGAEYRNRLSSAASA